MNLRFAKIAARLIAALPRRAVPPPSDSERDASILLLEEALRARGRRNRRRAVVAATGTVAAMAAGVALIILLRGDGAPEPALSIRAWGVEGEEIADGGAVRPGQSLNARESGARLALSSGTELRLAPRARIDVKTLAGVQRFRLPSGRLHADVAPLDAGQRFLIETPDGEIEVHGTIFDLAVVPPQPGCPAATSTRLTVTQGVVEVRSAGRDDYVHAGQHWPKECDAISDLSPPPAPPAAPPPLPGGEPDRALVVARRAIQDPARVAPTAPSELATQNNLFAAAMAAKARGQMTRARAELERLIARFPRGQLAEAAYAERMRIARQLNDLTTAHRNAREYLAAFPNGFSTWEARQILRLTPGAP